MKTLNVILVFLIASAISCSGSISYRSEFKVPTTVSALEEEISSLEARLEGLEKELEESKLSRDILVEDNKSRDGVFSGKNSIRNSNFNISAILEQIKYTKIDLAKCEARLKSLKEVGNDQ